MATNYTEHYQLNQWEPEDKVLRTDFNADNLKIDGALHTLAGAQALLAGTVEEHGQALELAGNCQVVCGSYTGTGAASRSLTFDRMPALVVIRGDLSNAYTILPLVLVQGAPKANIQDSYNNPVSVSWENHTVSWSGAFDYYAANSTGKKYYYTALLM